MLCSRTTSLLAALLLLAGCSRQATVELKDGSTVRGFIQENRDGVLVVDVVEKDEERTAVAVSGDSIKQIKHPGTTATAVGVAALVVGGMLIAVSAINECTEYPQGQAPSFDGCRIGDGMLMIFGLAGTGAGLGLTSYGISVQLSSRARAKPVAEDAAAHRADPEARGLSLTARF